MLEIETLAHEIINPLNIIVGCAELSKLENSQNNRNKQYNHISEYLDLILNQSKECCSILKEQIENYKSKKFKLTEVHHLIEEIISRKIQHPLLKQNNLKIVFNSDCNSNNNYHHLILNLNLTYLKIIINNLILNAIKYSDYDSQIIINLKQYDDLNLKKYTTYNKNKSTSNKLIIEIKNKINFKIKTDVIFEQGNHLGLTLVDNLINAINGDWEMTRFFPNYHWFNLCMINI